MQTCVTITITRGFRFRFLGSRHLITGPDPRQIMSISFGVGEAKPKQNSLYRGVSLSRSVATRVAHYSPPPIKAARNVMSVAPCRRQIKVQLHCVHSRGAPPPRARKEARYRMGTLITKSQVYYYLIFSIGMMMIQIIIAVAICLVDVIIQLLSFDRSWIPRSAHTTVFGFMLCLPCQQVCSSDLLLGPSVL